MGALLCEFQSPGVLGVCMHLQRPDMITDMHIGFRIDNVHHHAIPGSSVFFFGCVLQGPIANENINLWVLLGQPREIVLHACALILIPSITSVGDQRHQSDLRLIT